MFSTKTQKAIARALKLMEEEAPPYSNGVAFTTSKATKDFWNLRLKHRKHERFEVLFLDNQHEYLSCETLFEGTVSAAAVYPRVIIERCMHHNASAIILAHNHPSGISEPSSADIQITRRIKQACELIDIRVLDHVIIGTEIYSFTEKGDL